MDHVLVRPTGSPLDHLDSNLALYDRPLLNLCNDLWDRAIKDAAQRSGIRVLLTGQSGNMTISYAGTEALAEAFVTGQWLRWARTVAAMCRTGAATPKQAVFRTLAPLVPEKLWSWLRPAGTGRSDPATYSAIHPDRLADLKRLERARRVDARHWPNPLADGIAIRLRVLGRDSGNYQAGNRAGWGIDVRDPTRDVRLVEFCLALPLTEYQNAGHNRAMVRLGLADRLPHTVRMGARRGLQAADWHERLAAGRDDITRELQRLSACPAAVRALDLSRLSQLVAAWPSGGWHRPLVTMSYRYALLRAISTGHFLRRVADGRH
jgi:asparagine synthase (glutamine-hydrolysing)